MPRPLMAALASLLLASPVLAQSAATDAALESRPPEPLAQSALPLDAAATDSLSEEQLARRIARLYVRQADLLETEASGDEDAYQDQLDALVRDVQLLAQRPGVTEQARFREVYSSVLTEYEQFYGEPALSRGEVYSFREQAFAAVDAVDGPLLEDVSLPASIVQAYQTVFPMDMNRSVESSLRFLQRSPGHVERLRSRADTYFPMVERILAEEGVPDELKYLAMVESALNPRAYSHAGAAGMWQFIPATGRAYGLRVTSEVDDRLNPEKATRAAARHLRDLYDRFGDWQLALAGYNCNPAVIAREVRRAEERNGRTATFWDIYNHIPRETHNYVPMFIATSIVLSNPEAHGFPASHEAGAPFTFDIIPVAGGTSLGSVAGILDVDASVLQALNPSLRRSRVPDQRDPWMLRIPSGFYTQHAEDLDGLAPRSARSSALYAAQTVNFGMRAFRPIQADTEPRIAATRPRARTTPAPRPTPVEAPPPVRTVAEDTPEPRAESRSRITTHRVRSGENLTMLAQRYGVTVRQIMNENNLQSTTIRVGQRLRINPDASRAGGAVASGPRTITHRVRSGENLTVIARRYGVTVQQIMNWNNLRNSRLRVGQRLSIQTRRNVG